MGYDITADAWYPAHETKPLVANEKGLPVHSDGYQLLKVIDKVWGIKLDYWQRRLIIAVLEVYPPGHPKVGKLRYQQAVISLPRQNGKSEIAAALGLYGLLTKFNGKIDVVSLATKVETADIVYGRVRQVIKDSPALNKRYKPTGRARGIVHRTNTQWTYKVYPGTEDKLNGIPMTVCIYDELHLIDPLAYNQAVLGTSGVGGITIGITTAGDANSELLASLYEQGKAGTNERLGFWLWEAAPFARVDDPQALIASNPAIACGRLDVDEQINLIRDMPEHQARRYRLNQFVATSDGWMTPAMWGGLDTGQAPVPKRGCVFGVDRSIRWGYASIVASWIHDGKKHVEVVASIPNASEDKLQQLCEYLNRTYRPTEFTMDNNRLGSLAQKLRKRAVPVRYNTKAQLSNVCEVAYAEISRGNVVRYINNDGQTDALLDNQVPRGVLKATGEGWRISVDDSIGEVDTLMAMVQALHGATTTPERTLGFTVVK